MGLDNFETETETKSETEEKKSREGDNFHELVELRRKKGISKELIEEIRTNHLKDYYPNATLEEGWSYRDAVAIQCVCGDRLIVDLGDEKVCDCTRKYANTNRSVVMMRTKQ